MFMGISVDVVGPSMDLVLAVLLVIDDSFMDWDLSTV